FSILFISLILFIPAFAITGPATAGVSYVTRNWSRDEHAFIWSDFKDAVKENWKQSLVISTITSVLPIIVFMCWRFYGSLANTQVIMIIPQVLILMLGIVWALSVTYMHPMIVGYRLKMRDLLRNSFLIAIARLPMSLGIRLLHCVPVAIAVAVALFVNASWAILGLLLYYLLIGFSLSRFITASYTNAVFDKFINSHISGAPVNRGLREETDDDDEEDIVVEMPRE
ncbi:MAG: YesL family protein, partial [Clostridia bacterium]|nr:YesL family protein [Clostridia bacterium]